MNTNIIYLIGFMASGKSTVGPLLAEDLNLPFLDLDHEIEKREQKTIKEIFEKGGEQLFRKIETLTLRELANDRKNAVIACGGGTVLKEENVEILKSTGICVLLTVSPETVMKRVVDPSSRPLLRENNTPERLNTLMNKRKTAYENAAHLSVCSDNRTPLRIVTEIKEILHQRKRTCP